LVLLTCVDIGPWMHGNADVLMSHIVSSERTSRLPACLYHVNFSRSQCTEYNQLLAS